MTLLSMVLNPDEESSLPTGEFMFSDLETIDRSLRMRWSFDYKYTRDDMIVLKVYNDGSRKSVGAITDITP